MQSLFHKQKQFLDYFYHHLDIASCESLCDKLLNSSGHCFLTGVGKSGYIAQKIAATLLSTGTRASFLPPLDALHGDLGMVSPGDSVLILSKSGETEELLQLIPFLKNRGVYLCGVTSHAQGRLVKQVDHVVVLPLQEELCPFGLAPTTSTEIQLLFGDVLAVAIMQAKGFTVTDFSSNHPSGQIGKRISVKVKELMLDLQKTPLCSPDLFLEEVLIDFTDKRCGCLIVVDKEKNLQGIFTDGDLRRALQAKGEKVLKQKIGDLMTRAPIRIEAEALAWDAMKLMEGVTTVLPVIGEGKVVGIVKMHDLVQAGL